MERYFRRRWRFWVTSFVIAGIAIPLMIFLLQDGIPVRYIYVGFYVIGEAAWLGYTFRRSLLNGLFLMLAIITSVPAPWIFLAKGTSLRMPWFFGIAAAVQCGFLFLVQDAMKIRKPDTSDGQRRRSRKSRGRGKQGTG